MCKLSLLSFESPLEINLQNIVRQQFILYLARVHAQRLGLTLSRQEINILDQMLWIRHVQNIQVGQEQPGSVLLATFLQCYHWPISEKELRIIAVVKLFGAYMPVRILSCVISWGPHNIPKRYKQLLPLLYRRGNLDTHRLSLLVQLGSQSMCSSPPHQQAHFHSFSVSSLYLKHKAHCIQFTLQSVG